MAALPMFVFVDFKQEDFQMALPYLADEDARVDAVIARLPDFARDTIASIEMRSAERSGKVRARAERIQEINADIESTRREIEHFNRQVKNSGAEPTEMDVTRLDALNERLRTLKTRRADLHALKGSDRTDLGREHFREQVAQLYRVPGFIDARVKVETPDDFEAAVAAEREEMGRLAGRRREISSGWVPRKEAEKSIFASIDALRASGAPDFERACRVTRSDRGNARRERMEWPQQYVGGYLQPNTAALLAWLDSDALKARAIEWLDGAYKGKESFTDGQRRKALADIDARHLEAERREEAMITLAEKSGIIIGRRGKASIWAILGIAPDPDAQAEADAERVNAKPKLHLETADRDAPIAGQTGGSVAADFKYQTAVTTPKKRR